MTQTISIPPLLLLVLAGGCGRPTPERAANGSTAPAPDPPLFRDVAAEAGLRFRWGHADPQRVTALDTIGHGCAFLDYDGDGRPDILLVGDGGAHLFHNDGGGRFRDVTARALPVPPAHCHFLGCSVADYDADGHPDIFLTGYGSTALYHNAGDGTFRDVTRGSGLEARGPYDWTTSAAWANLDGGSDGRLDLYVCRYVQFTPASKQLCSYHGLDGSQVWTACSPTVYLSFRGSLYRNEGAGHFRDVTAESGMADAHGNALGCMFCDANGDGLPDLYIANDVRQADLYLNVGHGRFRNVAPEAGAAFGADGSTMSGMGLDWGDYDNDGRPDLLVANYASQPKALFHNETPPGGKPGSAGGLRFVDQTYASGIGAPSLLPLTFGAHFLDVDNSGWLDIVFTNGHVQALVDRIDSRSTYRQSAQLFRHLPGSFGRFTDGSAAAGPDFTRPIVGRGMALADYDGDGRLDLLFVDDEGAPVLLHNESQARGHWIELQCLRSAGGPDAVGARVTARAGGITHTAEVRAGGSYLSADYPAVHIGLGAAGRIETLAVRWPGGRISAFHDVAADRHYTVTPAARDLRTDNPGRR